MVAVYTLLRPQLHFTTSKLVRLYSPILICFPTPTPPPQISYLPHWKKIGISLGVIDASTAIKNEIPKFKKQQKKNTKK